MHHPFAPARAARLLTLAAALTAAIALLATALSPPAHAEGPGSGSPWVASLGDSYISGEAGRWAGNTNESSSKVDALGSSAYYDNASGTGETIEGCHRSEVGRGLHRRRRERHQPRLLRGQDLELQHRRAVQARARLLQLRRPRRPGADAPALRRRPQREAAWRSRSEATTSTSPGSCRTASKTSCSRPNGGRTTAAKKGRSRRTSAPRTSPRSSRRSPVRSTTWPRR